MRIVSFKAIFILLLIITLSSCSSEHKDNQLSDSNQSLNHKTNVEDELCFQQIKGAYDELVFVGKFELRNWECAKYLQEFNEKYRTGEFGYRVTLPEE